MTVLKNVLDAQRRNRKMTSLEIIVFISVYKKIFPTLNRRFKHIIPLSALYGNTIEHCLWKYLPPNTL